MSRLIIFSLGQAITGRGEDRASYVVHDGNRSYFIFIRLVLYIFSRYSVVVDQAISSFGAHVSQSEIHMASTSTMVSHPRSINEIDIKLRAIF